MCFLTHGTMSSAIEMMVLASTEDIISAPKQVLPFRFFRKLSSTSSSSSLSPIVNLRLPGICADFWFFPEDFISLVITSRWIDCSRNQPLLHHCFKLNFVPNHIHLVPRNDIGNKTTVIIIPGCEILWIENRCVYLSVHLTLNFTKSLG